MKEKLMHGQKLKNLIRITAYKTILRPPRIRYCSQTIYETLLGCCRMWEHTSHSIWKERADRLLTILINIQKEDGGFDIGYDFNFGKMHKKGQSTSPELVGLVALCEYARLFGKARVKIAALKAVEWIRKYAIDMGEERFAIPYSPYTINEIMVYNGTSFACGALGCFLGQFGGDIELHRIYNGMIRYMDLKLTKDINRSGRFWYYNDQARNDLIPSYRSKIDYYHQMQQVEMHALAYKACPSEVQLNIIRDAADHIAHLHDDYQVIPYTNNPDMFKNRIHIWGFASIISGMLEASNLIPDRCEVYKNIARDTLYWLLEYAWNGEYFEPILNNDGSHIDLQSYMVRSDAWVFNALAAAYMNIDDSVPDVIIEKCVKKMETVDFSGPENHASNTFNKLLYQVMKRINY